jgi:hypothetical protein
MAAETPHEPFGATVTGVAALVPSAPIRDQIPAGQKGITTAQVETWLDELSNTVDLRLAGRERLRDEARKTALVDAARGVVCNGVASYVEAARFAERAAVADTSYAEVLWRRYQSGLVELVALLTGWLDDEDDAVPEPGGGSPAWSFPETAFPDGMRF